MKIIDLRSDTVTLPSDNMLNQIKKSKLGDDVYMEDITTNNLENLASDLTGKESALLVSSGTMGNLISFLVHCERGSEAIMGNKSHTFLYESGGISAYGGIHSHQLENNYDGTIDLTKIKNSIRTNDVHFPSTRLISIENTHNKCYGFPLQLDYIDKLSDIANENNIKIHMDGARIFNASISIGSSVKNILKRIDSVSFCLSKGLGSPIGSIICGTNQFISRARRIRKSLGGGMRQTGIISSFGIYSLKNMIDRLKIDHSNAQYLATHLNKLNFINTKPEYVKTNIVYFKFNHSELEFEKFLNYCKNNKILFGIYSKGNCRMVTHCDVTKDDIKYIVEKFSTYQL